MAQFMYLIRNEGADFSKYSANDFQELMKKYQAWTQKIKVRPWKLARDALLSRMAAASKFARLSRCSKTRSPLGWRGAACGSRRLPEAPDASRRCKQRSSKFFLQD